MAIQFKVHWTLEEINHYFDTIKTTIIDVDYGLMRNNDNSGNNHYSYDSLIVIISARGTNEVK